MLKTFNNFLNESYKQNPKFFSYTHYKLPNEEELKDINNYGLSSNEILNGFKYSIVGRGVMSKDNKIKIIESIKMLCNLYPDNTEYKKALIDAENITSKWI